MNRTLETGDLTIAMCGPDRKCEHDWSEVEQLADDGWVYGESLRCSKCKGLSIDSDIWGWE